MIFLSADVIMTNCEVSNCETGIYMDESSDSSRITSSYIHNNTIGIDIETIDIQITSCRIDDNEQGLIIHYKEINVVSCVFASNINGVLYDDYCLLMNCDFIDNTGYGIKCNGNVRDEEIYRCNFINNTHGIELEPPTINWNFHHNNFINNTAHIYVQKKGFRITLNKYQSNYYSDWDGTGWYHIYGFLNWDFNPAQVPN
jgi:nitrous oxidase accessory protein NosD